MARSSCPRLSGTAIRRPPPCVCSNSRARGPLAGQRGSIRSRWLPADTYGMSTLIHSVSTIHPSAIDDLVVGAGYALTRARLPRLGHLVEESAPTIALGLHVLALVTGHH